jgi:SAM-dependent methyltransferase
MKRVAPAAERNKLAIFEVLRDVITRPATLLEIASGTGQHAAFFARALPDVTWQPSDADAAALASISAYRIEAGLPNLRPPILLDASAEPWPIDAADYVLCSNMIHISPWRAGQGLLRGAARILPPAGLLILYGPFVVDGDFISDSNVAFDRELRAQNPEWGIRELRDVERAAKDVGLVLERVVPMPANNRVVLFRKTSGDER